MQSVLGYSQKYIPPSDDEIEKYQKEKNPAWINEVEKYLLSLSKKFEESTLSFSFLVLISNNGNVPAENTIVEFEALGGIFFKPPSSDDESNEKNNTFVLPTPPKPPEGRWVSQKDYFFDIMEANRKLATALISPISIYDSKIKDMLMPRIPMIPKKQDRNTFYWKNGKPTMPVKTWTYECEEFRHKIKTESFDLTVLMPIPLSEKDIVKAKVRCSVSAKNLPKPINSYIDLDITYIEGKTVDEIRKCLASIHVK
jgi:hypothetical protein